MIFSGLFVKHTFPLMGLRSGGIMKSGVGAPGRFAKSWVAINCGLASAGTLCGNLNLPVSLPVASKNTSITLD